MAKKKLGRPPSGRKAIHMRLKPEIWKQIGDEAQKTGLARGAFIEKLVKDYLDSKPP
jgi:hypothetical protein